jgi:hypothetical protein
MDKQKMHDNFTKTGAITTQSLYHNVLEMIGNFLYKESFPSIKFIQEGLLAILDMIQNCKEEGTVLYPEVLLTTSIEKITHPLTPKRIIPLGQSNMTEDGFRLVVKRCALLAKDGWVIFIEIGQDQMKYGLVSIEASEISLSLYQHVVGGLVVDNGMVPVVYIRRCGIQAVQLKGLHNECIISLSLQDFSANINNNTDKLIEALVIDIEQPAIVLAKAFFSRIFEEMTQQSHGTIIAVAKANEKTINQIKSKLNDGVFLNPAIDIVEHLNLSESLRTREASTAVRSFGSLIKAMISHDGITLFSTNGKVLGYNIFVRSTNEHKDQQIIGGARTRAYKELIKLNKFYCCYFKSQDGKSEIWRKDDCS